MTRECCEFICSDRKVAKFRKFYKHTLIPDEGFFQTVLMNTDYPGEIVSDDKRAIIWIPDPSVKLPIRVRDTSSLVASGQIKLRPKTFTVKDSSFLFRSKALFARKFDETVDFKIFDALENSFKRRTKPRTRVSTSAVTFGDVSLPVAQFLGRPN